MPKLLDTNVAILLRDGEPTFVAGLPLLGALPAILIVTLVELQGGLAAPAPVGARRRAGLDRLLRDLEILELDLPVVGGYRRIIDACGFSRRKVLDRLIAATAVVHGMTLVTSNPTDFRDIPGLRLETWPAPQ